MSAPSPSNGSAFEAARRRAICLSLAYKASNYYDALFLRTGRTAEDNMSELAAVFEAEWIEKHNAAPSKTQNEKAQQPRERQ